MPQRLPRHYNRIGGTCMRGHPLRHDTAYKRRTTGGWQCATCAELRRAEQRRKRAEPPTERPCERCEKVLPLAAFATAGTKRCRRCVWTVNNARRCSTWRAETAQRRDEAETVVNFLRTGVARLATARGWDADRVAAALGVPPSSLAYWLRGKRLPQRRRVAVLAEGMAALLARSEATDGL